jgi:hypothetical protein
MNALNKKLWDEIKKEIKEKYNKRWNAFYSGLLVQEYKKRGGKFIEKKVNEKNNNLKRWYAEEWVNINDKSNVIVYRPTKKITSKTPTTLGELDKKEINKKIKEKEKIQNTNKNLTKFESK